MKWIISGVVLLVLSIDVFATDETFNRKIYNQSDLNKTLESLYNAKLEVGGGSRNISLEIFPNDYILDVVKLVRAVNLTDGDTLTIRGSSGIVNITCTMAYEDLSNASYTRGSRIVYDGLVFISCPVRIQSVATVIVENCAFR